MYDAASSYATTPRFAPSGESGVTIPERLSLEKQKEIYFQEIWEAGKGGVATGWKEVESRLLNGVVSRWRGQDTVSREKYNLSDQNLLYIANSLKHLKVVGIYYLISCIAQNPAVLHAAEIARRIRQLSQPIEDEPDACEVSPDSLRTTERLFSLYPRLRYPDITLTPHGNVYARWKGTNGSLLSMQLMPEMNVRFVVFTPNRKNPNKVTRISGTEYVDTVIESLEKAYDIADWIFE